MCGGERGKVILCSSFKRRTDVLQVLCSEVGTDCFNDICEFTWIHRTIGELPSQGIRFLSAIFLYEGVVHLLIIGLIKLYNSWTIERRIGCVNQTP